MPDEHAKGEEGDTVSLRPDADVLRQWDTTLQALWNPALSAALGAAEKLYAAGDEPDAAQRMTEPIDVISREFWRNLTQSYPRMPFTPAARFGAVERVCGKVLDVVRTSSPSTHFVEEYLTVALRPVRVLRLGSLTPDVCAALYDFYRGLWTPHLAKPQLHLIRTSLARTLAALPPDQMQAFWQNLQSPDPMRRRAMLLGLEWLRSAHALPHLLAGLTESRDHDVRALIVQNLETIADAAALPTLSRLKRETAFSDWTLSRLIARAMRVIEQQNAGLLPRTLLRPATSPPDPDASLLRPAADALNPELDRTTLVRPDPDEEKR